VIYDEDEKFLMTANDQFPANIEKAEIHKKASKVKK